MSVIPFSRTPSPQGSLEASAVYARLALGCPFSSSDEYEADLIRQRRAAGAYGPTPVRQRLRIASAGLLAGVLLFSFLFG